MHRGMITKLYIRKEENQNRNLKDYKKNQMPRNKNLRMNN